MWQNSSPLRYNICVRPPFRVWSTSILFGWEEEVHSLVAAHGALREAAVKLGYLTAEEFDRRVRPERMVSPQLGG